MFVTFPIKKSSILLRQRIFVVYTTSNVWLETNNIVTMLQTDIRFSVALTGTFFHKTKKQHFTTFLLSFQAFYLLNYWFLVVYRFFRAYFRLFCYFIFWATENSVSMTYNDGYILSKVILLTQNEYWFRSLS